MKTNTLTELKTMKIIAYTYEAGYHCPNCAKKRQAAAGFEPSHPESRMDIVDEHGLPLAAADREGNPVHTVFSTDETPGELPEKAGGCSLVVCVDCGDIIQGH